MSRANLPSVSAETVLVVDDSRDVCELIEILLCRVGYRVLTATNGADALEIARATPEIDLLLGNIEMPGMRGDEMAERFIALHPAAGVVFLSSWDGATGTVRLAEVLAKPFTVIELRDSVRRALHLRPAPRARGKRARRLICLPSNFTGA